MKKGIVLACCAMLLAGQLQSAEALDWNRRIGVDRMIDRTIDNTINRAVNKVEKQEKTRRVIFQNLPQSAAEIGPETDAQQVAAYTVAALARYETNPAEAIAMLNKLLGPRPVPKRDEQFLADRFRGKFAGRDAEGWRSCHGSCCISLSSGVSSSAVTVTS